MGSRADNLDRGSLPVRPALAEPLREEFGRRLVGYLIPAYVLMILAGVFLFRMHGSTMRGNEMSVDRAVFASVNAATLTGFQTAHAGPNDFQEMGQFTLVGLTVGGSLLTFIIGALAVVRIVRLPYTDTRVIASAVIAVAAAAFIGTTGLFGQGRTAFAGMSQGISALANCGVFIGGRYSIDDWQTYAILLPLILLGGLGLPVLMELFDAAFHQKPMSSHSRTVLGWSAGLYLFFFLLFLVLRALAAEWEPGERWETFGTILGSSSVQAINTRSAGMPIELGSSFQHAAAMQWAMILAMAIGASPGGAGGGVKSTTLAELYRGAQLALRGEVPGRPFGIALVWLGTYLGIALLAVLALLCTDAQLPGDRLLFLAISALSNVGLSHDVVSVSVPGSYILAAAMLVGRMAPLLVLWWMADTTQGAELAIG